FVRHPQRKADAWAEASVAASSACVRAPAAAAPECRLDLSGAAARLVQLATVLGLDVVELLIDLVVVLLVVDRLGVGGRSALGVPVLAVCVLGLLVRLGDCALELLQRRREMRPGGVPQ